MSFCDTVPPAAPGEALACALCLHPAACSRAPAGGRAKQKQKKGGGRHTHELLSHEQTVPESSTAPHIRGFPSN